MKSNKYMATLSMEFQGKRIEPRDKAYSITEAETHEKIAEGLTRAEAVKELLSLNNIVPMRGECYILKIGTGCTCCNYQDFFDGPYFTHEEAELSAATHKKRKTLCSPYTENGTQHSSNHAYEIVGTWIIIDEWYAVKIPQHLHDDLRTGTLTKEDLDNAFNFNELTNFK